MTPSWVAFTDDNERLIGEAAKNALESAENAIYDFKRFIGRQFVFSLLSCLTRIFRWDDVEVQAALDTVPYKVVNKNGRPAIEVTVKARMKAHKRSINAHRRKQRITHRKKLQEW